MKQTLIALVIATGLMTLTTAQAETAQQNRMKSCNDTAAKQSLSGDARKDFMKSCLSGKADAKAAVTPQQRMKDCNAQATAGAMKGDARKAFMKSCLSTKSN